MTKDEILRNTISQIDELYRTMGYRSDSGGLSEFYKAKAMLLQAKIQAAIGLKNTRAKFLHVLVIFRNSTALDIFSEILGCSVKN